MYRTLDASKIVATLDALERRVAERFPNAGLRAVCAELNNIARENEHRTRQLAQPNYLLRGLSGLVLIVGAALFVYVASVLKFETEQGNVFDVLEGVDAGFNIIVLMGLAVLFLVTLEGRWKRWQALADLDELRSVIHVIDMHQLTKDPATGRSGSTDTASSPKRTLSPFELVRYLDYCSEMLSLAAKVAALYAQSSKDAQVIAAAGDLQQITADLSAKIWQKINIAQTDMWAQSVERTTGQAEGAATVEAGSPTTPATGQSPALARGESVSG